MNLLMLCGGRRPVGHAPAGAAAAGGEQRAVRGRLQRLQGAADRRARAVRRLQAGRQGRLPGGQRRPAHAAHCESLLADTIYKQK